MKNIPHYTFMEWEALQGVSKNFSSTSSRNIATIDSVVNALSMQKITKRLAPSGEEKSDKKKESVAREFRVGVVSSSSVQFDVISRICTVTKYRARNYIPVQISSRQDLSKNNLDFLILCSSNPNIIFSWEQSWREASGSNKPLVYLCHPSAKLKREYALTSPVNASRLVKALDRFTIKELKFFPEFEIGHENQVLQDGNINGLRLLKKASNELRASDYQAPRKRALVVDDSLAVRRQMQIEFELLNDDLDVVDSAEAALSVVGENQYDIIFLDVVMPGMDGYAACKQIRKSKLNRNTPIVMLTSRSSSFDKFKGTLAGCAAYLVKPINHNEFEDVYRQHTGAEV